MTYGDVRALLRPYRGPFRVVLSNGESFNVWHREGFILTTGHIMIGLPRSPGSDEYEHSIYIDLAQVVRLAALPSQPA